ncbi:hypothetical protein [Microbacterium gilvum]|uniref:Uncharacterized protein n=1 Tax=Microbacterium gilvum TaxID=1336204 RepID=A0ABP9A0I7_9MICO
MFADEDAQAAIGAAQAGAATAAQELRTAAAALGAVADGAAWVSEAAALFRETARERALALYALADRIEGEGSALDTTPLALLHPIG